MEKGRKKLGIYTIILICVLTLIYIMGKWLFPDLWAGNKNAPQSGTQGYLTRTDDSNKKTYITIDRKADCSDGSLQICIVNPKKENQNWTFTWKVNGVKKKCKDAVYTPSQTENECFITAAAAAGGKTYKADIYLSSLPVVYMNTDEMIGDEYSTGDFRIQGNSTYTEKNSDLYNGEVSVKLRGNSTRNMPKRPYKIKLKEKADLLGMGASKHWVLLSNAIDHTFIRNKLVYDFSADLGADFAPQSDNVVLILNGEYQGVYQLCEHIRVSKERVNIYNWENLAEDAAKAIADKEKADKEFTDALEDALIADFSWISSPYKFTYQSKTYTMSDYVAIPEITGGFLLEMDFYHISNHDENSLQTNFLQPFYFNTPETGSTNKELTAYARDYIQAFEYALHSNDFIYHDNDTHYKALAGYFDWNSGWSYTTKETEFSSPSYDGMHYSQLFDMNSLVNNFLVCEFTVNWDSMKNSVFVNKDLASPASLSPNWDYDWAFGNINMFEIYTYFTDIWQTTDEYFTNEQCYQAIQWNRFLIRDPYFLFQVYEKYKEIRPTLLEDMIKEGGTLDTYYNSLLAAGQANDRKWQPTYNAYHGENFEDSFASLQNFITDRVKWLDQQFATFDTFTESLGYYEKSSEITVEQVAYQSDKTAVLTVKVNNPSAQSVSLAVNGTHIYDALLTDGTAVITIKSEDLQEKEHNITQIRIKDISGKILTKAGNKNNADTQTAISSYKVF